MNQVLHWTEMMGFDATSGLVAALENTLRIGALINHPMMMVVLAKEGMKIRDPLLQRNTLFPKDGVYARIRDGNLLTQGLSEWAMIGGKDDLEAVAVYLAEHTPPAERFAMMCSLIETLPAETPRNRDDSSSLFF